MHQKHCGFAKEFVLKNTLQKKEMQSTSSNDVLVLVFLHKKRKKQGFWVHPVLNRRQQQGESNGLIQELKLNHSCFHAFAGC